MKKAFTLIELLVVIVIIAVLAAIGIPMFLSSVQEARMEEGKLLLTRIGEAHRTFRIDYPKLSLDFGEANKFDQPDFDTTQGCDGDTMVKSAKNGVVDHSYLVSCGYIEPVKIASYAYDFYLCNPSGDNNDDCCTSDTPYAVMYDTKGRSGDKYASVCFVYLKDGIFEFQN